MAGTLYRTHKILQLLVVCPKSIVDVWQQEFEKFAAFDYSLAVLDGSGSKKADTIRYMVGTGLQVIVVNYESCWRLEEELMRWKPDMIVCDDILPDWLDGLIRIYEQPAIRVSKSKK